MRTLAYVIIGFFLGQGLAYTISDVPNPKANVWTYMIQTYHQTTNEN